MEATRRKPPGDTPPAFVLQFTERVVIHKARLSARGSTATSYSWLVWRPGPLCLTRFEWLLPCRKRLERPEDYDAPEPAA